MKKPQITTTIGTAGLSTSGAKLISLFDGMQINQLLTQFGSIPLSDFLTALVGMCFSVWAILHNEDSVKKDD